jgi:hypothetical protein
MKKASFPSFNNLTVQMLFAFRNLKAEDADSGPNGLVEYRVVPGDGSDRHNKLNISTGIFPTQQSCGFGRILSGSGS